MEVNDWYEKNSGWLQAVLYGLLSIGSGIVTGFLAVTGLRSDLNVLKQWKDSFVTATDKRIESVEQRQKRMEDKVDSALDHISMSLRNQSEFNARQEERSLMMLELLKAKH